MPKLIFAILAQATSIDEDSQLLSTFNIVEEITVRKLAELDPSSNDKPEMLIMPLKFVALFRRDDFDVEESVKLRLSFKGPDGELLSDPWVNELTLAKLRARMMWGLPGVPYKEFGTHWFVLELADDDGKFEEIASFPIEVIKQTE